ncbi:MAG: glycosyltransferase [Limnospira sp. PMC 1291.21]|uniref:Cellulose synthase (UDP-forming) n=2 Tax=Limnospira TaxID=2596745 RepID=B5VU71_LIMMA|nr:MULTISPECIES: glycosyltransferase family 2 protein [Limnospira]EKD10544.1 Cellulose synthase (UDP-forming) [Arthrospira platensis C1]MDC0836613.1 glycosyltransferase [Limnoraphis robusta]MDY7054755.1 glycosyltransferase [Limnospira fusiformis LS22]QJB28336.1 glycosyltransferase [Limnospira fusiformis SAG 85.79]EDZ97084.1 Cellulose synthase (UDP-forming) [Limnospira maxima CS-328]
MTSGFIYQSIKRYFRVIKRPNTPTLWAFGVMGCFSAIAWGWVSDQPLIRDFFQLLYFQQKNPPIWLQLPYIPSSYLWLPTILLSAIAFIITKIYPKPTARSRAIIVAIILALTIRYLLWRSLSTLNLSDPLNGLFSLTLMGLEIYIIGANIIQVYLIVNSTDRSSQADQLQQSVIQRKFTPTVDILIPTYNEPLFILRRTVIGCQALDYHPQKVYLLDDTNRPQVKQLAQELGCHYLTRPNNLHAKAGNLNHALKFTNGELITVFDADFIPTKNFLTRTVGFFQNPNTALVQTPQTFYNPDPVSRNLGLENIITPEEEVFYRHIQPLKDGAGSVVCAGTSFVVRRTALQAIGGFVTESISEDYFTGITLASKGYKLIYLNEKLSAGLAAQSITDHLNQRMRWARGTLQAFFINSNPLTIPGLTLRQRLAHLEGLLHWFTSISRIFILLMPLAYRFLGVIPIKASIGDFIYFFMPYYLVSLLAFAWLNQKSRSAFLSEIYAIFQSFPMALTVIQVMINPFKGGFKVTPKGKKQQKFTCSWKLASPIILLLIATMVSLFWNYPLLASNVDNYPGFNLGIIWSIYNLVVLSVSLLIVIDAPLPDIYDWFQLRRSVKLQISDQVLWGITRHISEVGAEIMITEPAAASILHQNNGEKSEFLPLQMEIIDVQLNLGGRITDTQWVGEFPTIRVEFEALTVSQHRQLVEMLFCRPGQWQNLSTPGELRSLWLLLRVLLKPKLIFDRKPRITAIAVHQH